MLRVSWLSEIHIRINFPKLDCDGAGIVRVSSWLTSVVFSLSCVFVSTTVQPVLHYVPSDVCLRPLSLSCVVCRPLCLVFHQSVPDVVSRLLSAVYRSLSAVCCSPFTVRRKSSAVRRLPFAVCCLPFVICRWRSSVLLPTPNLRQLIAFLEMGVPEEEVAVR